MKQDIYDLIIIGAGPAGLTASLYASRYNINHLVIGKIIGGYMNEAYEIGNFPGEENVIGAELAGRFAASAQKAGAKIISDMIVDFKKIGNNFLLTTKAKQEFITRTILLATGTKRRKLNIPGEEKFLGKGVSYCATCDGPLFKNKVVAVVGGGNAGLTAALYLSNLAQKVYIFERGNNLIADEVWQEKVRQNKKIEVILNNNLERIEGGDLVERIILEKEFNRTREIRVDGVFIEIGSVPDKEIIKKLKLQKDERGYIKISEDGSTSVKGIWAAGDVTSGSNHFRQIITACAEGAIAADSIHQFLKG